MKKKYQDVKERPKSILDRLVFYNLEKNIYLNKSKVVIVEIFKSSIMNLKFQASSLVEKSEEQFSSEEIF